MKWNLQNTDSSGRADTQKRLPRIALLAAGLAVLALSCDATGEEEEETYGHTAAESRLCPQADPLWSDIDLAEFKPIPHLRDLDLTGHVRPAVPATYWELRSALPIEHWILARAGQACSAASNPSACHQGLADLRSNAGFTQGCLPLRCVSYLVVNRGDTLQMITDRPGVRTFLGTIDTPLEAALLAFAHGYTWSSDEPDQCGVRAVPGGFELLVAKLVRDCDPVTIDRFLLTVTTDGTLVEQRRQHASVACGACI